MSGVQLFNTRAITPIPVHATTFIQMRTILDLPLEVLAMIFEFGYEDGDMSFISAVCLTCRLWYQLSIVLPRLWSSISITHETSLDRIKLWIERSRSSPLNLSVSFLRLYPDTDQLLTRDEDEAQRRAMYKGIEISLLLHRNVDRWRSFRTDCWWEPTKQETSDMDCTSGWEDVYAEFGKKQPILLEELVVNWSGAATDLQSFEAKIGGYPKLRKVTFERTMCHWAPHYMVPSLTYISLLNVEDLHMDRLLEGMKGVPLLEEIHLNEVVWDPSTLPNSRGDDGFPVTLPQLHTLSVTGGNQHHHFIRNLLLPKLYTVLLGDIIDDLSPTFQYLSASTSSIEHLTTGMWNEEHSAVSERSLICLLEKQSRLHSLYIRDALLSDLFITALLPAPSPDDSIAPLLKQLQIPVEGINHGLLHALVRSRAASDNSLRRLQRLVLQGEVACSVAEGISPFVDILEMEAVTTESEMEV